MSVQLPQNFDEKFGPSRQPDDRGKPPAVSEWEKKDRPYSLTKLTDQSASHLKSLMDMSLLAWKGGATLINDINIIWIVDDNGCVWFAIEELHNRELREREEICHARHRNLQITKALQKLGHPALILGDKKKARIGGEIYFEPRNKPPLWIINNQSGRYGFGPAREERHLSEVTTVFKTCGIDLEEDFRPPW